MTNTWRTYSPEMARENARLTAALKQIAETPISRWNSLSEIVEVAREALHPLPEGDSEQ